LTLKIELLKHSKEMASSNCFLAHKLRGKEKLIIRSEAEEKREKLKDFKGVGKKLMMRSMAEMVERLCFEYVGVISCLCLLSLLFSKSRE